MDFHGEGPSKAFSKTKKHTKRVGVQPKIHRVDKKSTLLQHHLTIWLQDRESIGHLRLSLI